MNMVALGRVVLTSREHVIALEPRGKGLMGTLLRYPYEVRAETEYFEDIPERKIAKDMMELAKHIVETKAGHFHPEHFKTTTRQHLKDLIEKKAKGVKIAPRPSGHRSRHRSDGSPAQKCRCKAAAANGCPGSEAGKKKIPGQKEMLLPISGKKSAAVRLAARAESRRAQGRLGRWQRSDPIALRTCIHDDAVGYERSSMGAVRGRSIGSAFG